jgi:hypothetical protein
MVQKFADGDTLDKLWHAAYMVDVVVGDEQVINVRDAGVAHGRQYAVSIAGVMIWPSRIDKQGRAARSDEQRGLAALNVNGVNEQMTRRLVLGLRWLRRGGKEQSQRANGEQQMKKGTRLRAEARSD